MWGGDHQPLVRGRSEKPVLLHRTPYVSNSIFAVKHRDNRTGSRSKLNRLNTMLGENDGTTVAEVRSRPFSSLVHSPKYGKGRSEGSAQTSIHPQTFARGQENVR